MDFSFTEDQNAVKELAHKILADQVTAERQKELDAADASGRIDRATWSRLADANLLGLALPEAVGGSGLGFIEACLVLEEVGRTAAMVPALATLVMGAAPIAEFGTPEQQTRWLPGVVRGEEVVSAALVEATSPTERPATTARRRDAGWVLDGAKVCVPYGQLASRVLISATTGPGEVGLFMVGTGSAGVHQESLETTSGHPESALTLAAVHVPDADVLVGPAQGAAALEWVRQHTTAGLCILMVGVCEEALRLTAEYTKTREQFDKVIATFQAVGQRAADAYIDTEGVRLTAWQAAWRLASGLPSAESVAIAKYWAAEAGQRVVHAAQHLHGGIGVDRDYPLHRYFLLAKQLELTLGGTTAQLLRLGAILADEPVST